MKRRYVLTLLAVSALILVPDVRAGASLNLNPSAKTVMVNEEFSLKILVDTGGENIGGVGAKILFDPEKILATKIVSGEIMADYPAAIIDNTSGKLTISGIAGSADDLFSGADIFATVTFRAVAAGQTKISFAFQPGATTDSNVAVSYGNGDILSQVNQSTITIEGTGGGGDGDDDDNDDDDGTGGGDDEYTATPAEDDDNDSLISQLLSLINPSGYQSGYTPPGRSNSEVLSADSPLPRQSPITDPSQSQSGGREPVFTSEPQRPAVYQLTDNARYIQTGAAGVSGAGLAYGAVKLIAWLKKRKQNRLWT